MALQISLYTWLQALSTVVAAALAVLALDAARRRPAHRTKLLLFAAFTTSAVVWSAGYGIMMTFSAVPVKIVGWQTTVVGATFLSVSWLLFALAYTGSERWLNRRVYAGLGAVAVAYSTLVVVDPVPTLMRVGELRAVTDPLGTTFLVLDHSFTVPFLAWAAWAHLLVLLGSVVFVRFVGTEQAAYRGQSALQFAAVAVPLTASVAFFVGVSPDGLNFSSLSFAFSGVVFWVAIRRYRLLDVVPVARESVIEHMRDGYVVVDERWTVVDANPAAQRLTPGDGPAVGDAIADILPESEAVLDDETPRTEVSVETEAGRRYLNLTASALSGSTDIGTLLVLQDVTERRSTERRYQTIIEHSTDLITLLDRDGSILYESPSVKHVLGYEQGSRIGESAFEYIHPEDRERLRTEFDRGITKPGYKARFEYRVRNADGSWQVHESIGRNLLEHPDVGGVVVNARDVTERKRREREVREERERLDRFASVVSHDLRNPLAIASGYLDLLSERVPDESEDDVRSIRESHERMDQIIEDALSMARDGRDVEAAGPVPLAPLVRDAWSVVETGDAALSVETDATVDADRPRLGRVFENLFRNSVEHAGPDADDGSADRLEVTVRDCEAGFAVEDNGPGVPAAIRENLFEPGISGNVSGTGLGLSIVSSIVDAHGWSIRAESGTDGGARFVVETEPDAAASDRLPRADDERNDAGDQVRTGPPHGSDGGP